MTEPNESHQEDYFAALDIGSNSFHFVLARLVDQQLQILHAEKYRVQLAQGLDEDQILSDGAIARGIAVLEKLATSMQHIDSEKVRAVATFTLRQASNSAVFLKAAAKVFPFHIEIISGHEEARLIYQGVAHHRQNNQQQLVIDIGGGSTECIIGQAYKVRQLDSLNIGCVSFQKAFFKDGKISENAFKMAIQSANHQVDAIAKRFKKCGWQHVIGTSGTIKAITKIINVDNEVLRPITLKDVKKLKKQLLTFEHCDAIEINGLKENRRSVICSGVAVLIAVMQCLDVKSIEFCQYALREGVLFEHSENLQHNNVRERTVTSFVNRFNVDTQHAESVKALALDIFNQANLGWPFSRPFYRELLIFAAELHELGVDINASGYQKHGQYIIEQADMAGFNQEQQLALAWLVGNQRKKITPAIEERCYLLSVEQLNKLCVILRLSVLLNQQRLPDDECIVNIKCRDNKIHLFVDQVWLLERPIISTELFYEQSTLSKLGYELTISSTK